jgi:hypothetical protein
MTLRLLAAVMLVLVAPVIALDGDPRMHDPSTVALHDGRFYATGRATVYSSPSLMTDGRGAAPAH